MNQTDEHEPEPKPAVLLFYEGDQWDAAVKKFYKKNPNTRGKISLILMPKNGQFTLRNFKNENRRPGQNVKTGT
jgi:hypothetical protein